MHVPMPEVAVNLISFLVGYFTCLIINYKG